MKSSFIQTCLSLLLLAAIQPTCTAATVRVTPSNEASNLPLGGQGGWQSTQIIKVGTINLSTTSQNGFTLTINGNSLAKSDGETPISIQITTVPHNASPPSAGFTTSPYTYQNNTANASEIRDLYIKYTPAPLQDPGNYTNTLNLTLIDNTE